MESQAQPDPFGTPSGSSGTRGPTTADSLGDITAALASLTNAGLRLGADVLQSVTGRRLPPIGAEMQRLNRAVMGGMSTMIGGGTSTCRPRGGCCSIPEPCWMPKSLGECTSHVAQCKTACVRFRVTSCDRVRREITAKASGAGAGSVTISPPALTLDPFERGMISACITVPETAKNGSQLETLLWVVGCKEYYLRWTVSVGTLGVDSCHEMEVCDCPDYLHHWYDHFYCPRPCPPRSVSASIASPGMVAAHG